MRAWEARYRRVASWDTTHPSGIAAQKREKRWEPAAAARHCYPQHDILTSLRDITARPSTGLSLLTFPGW